MSVDREAQQGVSTLLTRRLRSANLATPSAPGADGTLIPQNSGDFAVGDYVDTVINTMDADGVPATGMFRAQTVDAGGGAVAFVQARSLGGTEQGVVIVIMGRENNNP